MKKLLSVFLAVWFVASVVESAAAQEMSLRKGVVTGITPIQTEAKESGSRSKGSSTGGALSRAFGRAVGRAVSRAAGEYVPEAYDVGHGVADDVSRSARNSGSGRMVTAFLVTVRFDDGSESAIQAARAEGLRVGARVNVVGSGSATQVLAAN